MFFAKRDTKGYMHFQTVTGLITLSRPKVTGNSIFAKLQNSITHVNFLNFDWVSVATLALVRALSVVLKSV